MAFGISKAKGVEQDFGSEFIVRLHKERVKAGKKSNKIGDSLKAMLALRTKEAVAAKKKHDKLKKKIFGL